MTDEALDVIRDVLHGTTDRNTVTDVRPALEKLACACAAVARVRELHREVPHPEFGTVCDECPPQWTGPYPCPTVRALDGETPGTA